MFGPPASERLAAYRRLDLLGELAGAVGPVRTSVYLQVANALGRRNALGTRSYAAQCGVPLTWPVSAPSPMSCTPQYAADAGLIPFPLLGVRASF